MSAPEIPSYNDLVLTGFFLYCGAVSWYGFIQKYFGLFFAAGIALGLWLPGFFRPVSEHVILILSVVMSLTFLSIDLKAAWENLKRFHNVGAALLISKAVFPLLLYFAARPFGEAVSIGVLLLGLTPFAAVSPTLTKLIGGDTEFIIICQVAVTLLAPFYMPALLLLFAGASIEVDVLQMMKTLIFLILIPFGISLVLRPLIKPVIAATKKYYSALTILLITLLLTGLLSGAAEPIMSNPLKALPMGIIAFVLGMVLSAAGWFGFFFLDRRKRIGLSVANLYMNIGLTAVIAAGFFGADVMLFILLYELPANLFPGILGRIFSRGLPNKVSS